MARDRLLAEYQLAGNVAIRQPLRNQAKNLELSVGQPGDVALATSADEQSLHAQRKLVHAELIAQAQSVCQCISLERAAIQKRQRQLGSESDPPSKRFRVQEMLPRCLLV